MESFNQRWKNLSNNSEKEYLMRAVKERDEAVQTKILAGKTDFKLKRLHSLETCKRITEYLKNYKNEEGGEFYVKKYFKREPQPCANCDDEIITYCDLRYRIN